MRLSLIVTFVSAIHSWSHKKSSLTQLTPSMMMPKTVRMSKEGFLFRPSHTAALVHIHMDAAPMG